MSSEKKALIRAITLWNESRLDLFEISQPDKNFEFHGVIRFYHQDSSNDGKYSTKCVRVSNTAATLDVIETLSEKFRSDMRMLTKPSYALYEVHVNGEARKLIDDENPLMVQLKWIKDDREGRFLLRNEDDKRPVHVGNGLYEESEDTIKGFKLTRNLTKKEKKQKKKKEKINQKGKEETHSSSPLTQENLAAKQLYNEVPESTFTRTVSNPEAVMKKRREQKLQKRGAEQLKIYGDSINKEIPYKTLLLLPSDDTDTVIRDVLDKYGLGKEKTIDYMLVQVVLPPGSKPEECLEGGWGKETILGPEHQPLDIAQKWQPHQGTLVFQLRPSTASYVSRKKQKTASLSRDEERNYKNEKEGKTRKKERAGSATDKGNRNVEYENVPKPSKRPKLLEILGPEKILTHTIAPNVTEIGSDRRNASYGPFLELRQVPGLLASHCVITNMDGVVTVTPHDNDGEVFVDGRLIEETTMLTHGNVVWLGRGKHLVYCDPGKEISIPEIQKRIRATAPRDQPNRQLQNASSNLSRQRDGSSSNVSSASRPRHHSANSSASSKSSSVTHSRGQLPEQKSLQNIRENRAYEPQMRRPQSQLPLTKAPSDKALQHRSLPPQTATVQPIQQSNPHKLPASLRVAHGAEEPLITEVLSAHANSLHFKLSPAYSIYLIQRYFVETNCNNILPNLLLVTDLLERTIQLNGSSVSELSFWMANTSELLNFIRQDQDLTSITAEIQDNFAKTVQLSFRHLVQCMQRTLFELMPAFLSDSDEDLPGGNDVVDLKKQNRNTSGPTMYDILHMLSSAMSLLRRCRVNAALTIQLFSQLFHSVNMWLFNKLVASTDSRKLCCREWGIRIRARLAMVETWAEKQGLELAADCHLARITQATHLLQAPKHTGDDIAAISGTCFKLNSIQLRVLLSNYQPDERDGERRISAELIDQVVAYAERSADELTRSDGRDVQLEEDPDLQLPFLLPEDGYSCDVVQGVPSGLTEFLHPLQQEGLCTYNVESSASGNWTAHFQSILQQYQNVIRSTRPHEQAAKPEVTKMTFKKQGGGMGLSIVAARGVGQEKMGIYIRSVVRGGAADVDGRLQAGDQLLTVDGQTLVGLDQARAAELMTKTGSTVLLEVAKQGAVYHGLAKLLSQPSPKMQHIPPAQRRINPQHGQPRPRSEGYALYANETTNTPSSAHAQLFGNARSHAPPPKMSTLNQSTPQLNETIPSHSIQPVVNNVPRPAKSMGNLQNPAEPEVQSPRNFQFPPSYDRHQPASMASTRRIATSQTALSPSSAHDVADGRKEEWRKYMQEKRAQSKSTKSPVVSSPRDSLPSPPSTVNTPRSSGKYPQNSIDNPNYEHFPSPPPDLINDHEPDRHFTPVKTETPPADSSRIISPRHAESGRRRRRSASPPKVESTPSSGTKTLDRPTSGKKTEVARVAPTQKKKQQASPAASKSATLPRHFKSASPWDRDEREKKEQSIQEQLNALRDEEIDELSARTDLTPFEGDRLKNLLQEREFQARVQEEKMKMFSDDDLSEEDFSVPDRPDRDRLIRIEGAHALRDAAARVANEKEDEDQIRWKEEHERKKKEAELRAKQEAERREERKRERERAERERQEEIKRRELLKREEERRYEEEQARLRDKEEEYRMNYNSLQREEEEQRRRLEEIRKMREDEENQLLELQAKRQAEERSHHQESAHKRQEDKLLKQREADAREEAERELLEQKLSMGKPSNFSTSYKKYAPIAPYSPRNITSSSGGQVTNTYKNPASPISMASNLSQTSAYDPISSRPVMRENAKTSVRPVSDGYALGKTDWAAENLPPPPSFAPTTPPASYSSRRPISYVSSTTTPKVIGAQEIYNDPRNKRETSLKRDQSTKRRGPDPSRLTFKDRQRMFQGGSSSPVTKTKSSRKLLELEESLRGQV